MKTEVKMKLFYIVLCMSFFLTATSQAPFSRGVNLTGWFQADSPGLIQFTRFTKQDLINIKSLGCDVIRLPVNMHSMTSGSPQYTLDPLYISFLDSVVTWCEDLNLYIMIDNHSFDPNVNTSADIGDILTKVWSQTALHFKNRSDYILYEILNEPHGISTALWGTIQGQVISAIRAADQKHIIVVGGSGYNSYSEMLNLPVYTDPHLLYTFHFYDPFMFTHQGASWTSPSMVPLAGVPFPYDAARMPVCPASLRGTWIEGSLNSYPSEGTVDRVKQLIDNAINFRNNRQVNIFCGEFGVFIPNSDPADRANWYGIVRQYFEDNNIPWTTWDYKGTFGLFKNGSNEMFEHDLNIPLIQSLNLSIPAQTPYIVKPDSIGFTIYSDYIGPKILDASSSTGPIDFYSPDLPNNNNYCLYWSGFNQYNAIGFDLSPDRDLTRLVSEGYSVDFMVRGNVPGIRFDIRFTDSKTIIPGDHPWRIGATIDETITVWDSKWHHVNIPLTTLTERGSWDNNTWYNPAGKFDWSSVDRFDISTEYPGTTGKQLWLDNIHITDQDTALVREFGTMGIEDHAELNMLKLKVAPNPVTHSATISFELPGESPVRLSIISLLGEEVISLVDETLQPGYQSFTWDGCTYNGIPVRKGIYICILKAKNQTGMIKIIRI